MRYSSSWAWGDCRFGGTGSESLRFNVPRWSSVAAWPPSRVGINERACDKLTYALRIEVAMSVSFSSDPWCRTVRLYARVCCHLPTLGSSELSPGETPCEHLV